MAITRRGKLGIGLLVLFGALLLGIRLSRNWIARKALERVAKVAEAGGYQVTFGDVDFSLLGRHIRVADLAVTPALDSLALDSSSTFSIQAAAIDLRGVDVLALIRHKVLHVGHIRIHAPQVEHTFASTVSSRTKAGPTRPDEEQKGDRTGLSVLRADTIQITNAKGHSQDMHKDHPALAVGQLDVLLTGAGVSIGDNGKPSLMLNGADIRMRDTQAHLEPFYHLHIDSLWLGMPQDTAVIFGLSFTPDVNARNYREHVKYQVELYQARVDTILLSGFDLAARLDAGILRAQRLHLAGAVVEIHRDKSIPMRPDPPRKPLLAETLQGLTNPIALDSITIRRSRITYHERLVKGANYGSLTFADVHGTLTGLHNMRPDGAVALHLDGRARVWDKARAHLDLRMTKGSTPTQIELHVELRELPAVELSRMTDDLVHVKATQGWIHRVDMRMRGDDRQGSATVEMHYDSLKIELAPTVQYSGLLTHLANTVIRSTNMPEAKGYRVGKSAVERRQEAGIFNYLWLGLREGMMDVMLPKSLLEQMNKKKNKKVQKANARTNADQPEGKSGKGNEQVR
ncbi:MAG: hypothetical protein JNM31_09805 [Flavobacteriales bacterium]|nr:hypothetical protein [Flavobacteriales bacterium]